MTAQGRMTAACATIRCSSPASAAAGGAGMLLDYRLFRADSIGLFVAEQVRIIRQRPPHQHKSC
jgi:hypothetical protein